MYLSSCQLLLSDLIGWTTRVLEKFHRRLIELKDTAGIIDSTTILIGVSNE